MEGMAVSEAGLQHGGDFQMSILNGMLDFGSARQHSSSHQEPQHLGAAVNIQGNGTAQQHVFIANSFMDDYSYAPQNDAVTSAPQSHSDIATLHHQTFDMRNQPPFIGSHSSLNTGNTVQHNYPAVLNGDESQQQFSQPLTFVTFDNGAYGQQSFGNVFEILQWAPATSTGEQQSNGLVQITGGTPVNNGVTGMQVHTNAQGQLVLSSAPLKVDLSGDATVLNEGLSVQNPPQQALNTSFVPQFFVHSNAPSFEISSAPQQQQQQSQNDDPRQQQQLNDAQQQPMHFIDQAGNYISFSTTMPHHDQNGGSSAGLFDIQQQLAVQLQSQQYQQPAVSAVSGGQHFDLSQLDLQQQQQIMLHDPSRRLQFHPTPADAASSQQQMLIGFPHAQQHHLQNVLQHQQLQQISLEDNQHLTVVDPSQLLLLHQPQTSQQSVLPSTVTSSVAGMNGLSLTNGINGGSVELQRYHHHHHSSNDMPTQQHYSAAPPPKKRRTVALQPTTSPPSGSFSMQPVDNKFSTAFSTLNGGGSSGLVYQEAEFSAAGSNMFDGTVLSHSLYRSNGNGNCHRIAVGSTNGVTDTCSPFTIASDAATTSNHHHPPNHSAADIDDSTFLSLDDNNYHQQSQQNGSMHVPAAEPTSSVAVVTSKAKKPAKPRTPKAKKVAGTDNDAAAATLSTPVSQKNNSAPPVPDENKKFACPECGKSFRLRVQVKQHDDIVHKRIRPYKCDVCDMDFSCKGNHMKHIETKSHKEKERLKEAAAAGVDGDGNNTNDDGPASTAAVLEPSQTIDDVSTYEPASQPQPQPTTPVEAVTSSSSTMTFAPLTSPLPTVSYASGSMPHPELHQSNEQLPLQPSTFYFMLPGSTEHDGAVPSYATFSLCPPPGSQSAPQVIMQPQYLSMPNGGGLLAHENGGASSSIVDPASLNQFNRSSQNNLSSLCAQNFANSVHLTSDSPLYVLAADNRSNGSAAHVDENDAKVNGNAPSPSAMPANSNAKPKKPRKPRVPKNKTVATNSANIADVAALLGSDNALLLSSPPTIKSTDGRKFFNSSPVCSDAAAAAAVDFSVQSNVRQSTSFFSGKPLLDSSSETVSRNSDGAIKVKEELNGNMLSTNYGPSVAVEHDQTNGPVVDIPVADADDMPQQPVSSARRRRRRVSPLAGVGETNSAHAKKKRNSSVIRQTLDDVDERDRVAAELELCRAELVNARKLEQNLMSDTEQLQADREENMSRIRSLNGKLRYKEFMIDKLKKEMVLANGAASTTDSSCDSANNGAWWSTLEAEAQNEVAVDSDV